MSEDEEAGTAPPKRGRPARDVPARPIGYRATEATRRELRVACGFAGHDSLQAIVDAAVHHYLDHLRDRLPTFRTASDELRGQIATDNEQVT